MCCHLCKRGRKIIYDDVSIYLIFKTQEGYTKIFSWWGGLGVGWMEDRNGGEVFHCCFLPSLPPSFLSIFKTRECITYSKIRLMKKIKPYILPNSGPILNLRQSVEVISVGISARAHGIFCLFQNIILSGIGFLSEENTSVICHVI